MTQGSVIVPIEGDPGPVAFNDDGAKGGDDIKTRSANIHADPRMSELKHYEKSHQHEMRLRAAAELENRVSVPEITGTQQINFRNEGCDAVDAAMKRLSKEEAVVPCVPKSGELPERFRARSKQGGELKESLESKLAQLRRMDSWQTRLTWRENMDHSLKRLMIDMDLSRDERLKEFEIKKQATMAENSEKKEEEVQQRTRFAEARCAQLDKIYAWYVTHGRKEVRKERKAPSYLRYSNDGPVMPGSLRAAPMMYRNTKSSKPAEANMSQSSSSPALLAAGVAATGGPAPSAA